MDQFHRPGHGLGLGGIDAQGASQQEGVARAQHLAGLAHIAGQMVPHPSPQGRNPAFKTRTDTVE